MKRLFAYLPRALLLRCPACGRAPIVVGWLQTRPSCPSCGLRLEREEGYFLGAMLVNVIVSEGLFIVGLIIAILRSWPHPPWTLLTIGSAIAVVLFPILFWPFSRTLWLAFDLAIQPPQSHEYASPGSPPDPSPPPRSLH